jgi:hypothetical protein
VTLFACMHSLKYKQLCETNHVSIHIRIFVCALIGWLTFSAISALEKLNHSIVKDKAVRLMWSNRDPDARKSGIGNVFVKVKECDI